jgi:hypothetical protein
MLHHAVQSITSAPTDAAVKVIHGKPQAVALAVWDAQLQVWIRVDDPQRRALHRVTTDGRHGG